MLSTVIAGVLVFLLGQLVLKCVIEPVQVLKATIARVSNLLLLHQAKLMNASCDDAIAEDMKRLSAEIISHSYHILWFPVSRLAFGLPSRMSLVNAAQDLNMLYYGMLHAARKAEIDGGYGSGSQRVMRNFESMKRIIKYPGITTDYSATAKQIWLVRVFIEAKKRMGRRLHSQ